jgi:hypothetical protein
VSIVVEARLVSKVKSPCLLAKKLRSILRITNKVLDASKAIIQLSYVFIFD